MGIDNTRIRAKSKVTKQKIELDSIKAARMNAERRSFDVLMQANSYWSNMSEFRKDRERNKNYNYGKQWEDVISVDGKTMTEVYVCACVCFWLC